jgi:DNA-binding FadR family transcriptional regulator
MAQIELESDLLDFIIRQGYQAGDRLPTINELQASDYLGVGISKVREQLEVARALGLVEVRSKTGMRMRDYSFAPAVRLSLFFALAQDQHNFELFSEVRNHIEVAFWNEACALLDDDDKSLMCRCVDQARAKLGGQPIRIPNEEHRAFHLTVFKRLDNPFVMGILEAYWDAYDAVELNRYADLSYHQQVWNYHERILDALGAGDFDGAKALFIEHTRLLRYQPRMQDIHQVTIEPGSNGSSRDFQPE